MVLPFITIEVIQEIAQPTVNPGNIQILQGSAVILKETNYLAIGLWSLYNCSNTRFGDRFSPILSKMKRFKCQIILILVKVEQYDSETE
jgi:hypothetical protein